MIEDDKLIAHNLKVLEKLRIHFKDDFFIYTLKIPSKKINDFIEYIEHDDIIRLFEKERYLEIIDVFVKKSKPFLKDFMNEK